MKQKVHIIIKFEDGMVDRDMKNVIAVGACEDGDISIAAGKISPEELANMMHGMAISGVEMIRKMARGLKEPDLYDHAVAVGIKSLVVVPVLDAIGKVIGADEEDLDDDVRIDPEDAQAFLDSLGKKDDK